MKTLTTMIVFSMIATQNSLTTAEPPQRLADGPAGPSSSRATADRDSSSQSQQESVENGILQSKNPAQKAETILRTFDNEPTLTQLKDAACAFADADPHTAKRWRRAPNIAALLPVVKIAIDHDLERDETLDKRQDEPDFWGVDTDRDWGFQLSAQWKLSELIFHSDEVRVWGALADRASRREAVLALLVGYFFERRRVQLQILLEPPQTLAEMVTLQLRLQELTASIDSLTNGALTAGLAGVKR